MGKRSIRVNELIKREISALLHTVYQAEAVCITITNVEISPDLRNGRIFYSVFGGEEKEASASKLFKRHGGELSRLMGKNVTLKYMPKLKFVFDDSMEQGFMINEQLDQLDTELDTETEN